MHVMVQVAVGCIVYNEVYNGKPKYVYKTTYGGGQSYTCTVFWNANYWVMDGPGCQDYNYQDTQGAPVARWNWEVQLIREPGRHHTGCHSVNFLFIKPV